jgi:hypothetical protein
MLHSLNGPDIVPNQNRDGNLHPRGGSLAGLGAGLDLYPWVHPHPTQGGSGCGCGFQSAPTDPHWAPFYNPCTTILGPETRRHPKPADTR